jgi:hypothetical protein
MRFHHGEPRKGANVENRRYRGLDGQHWWTVDAVTPPAGARLRDRRMAGGWLRFRSDCGKEVCVAPIPPGWRSFDMEHLEAFRVAGQNAGYSDRLREG